MRKIILALLVVAGVTPARAVTVGDPYAMLVTVDPTASCDPGLCGPGEAAYPIVGTITLETDSTTTVWPIFVTTFNPSGLGYHDWTAYYTDATGAISISTLNNIPSDLPPAPDFEFGQFLATANLPVSFERAEGSITSFALTDDGAFFSGTIIALQTTPLPPAWPLFLTGLGLLAWRRR